MANLLLQKNVLKYIFFLFLLVIVFNTYSQVKLTGKVIDQSNNSPVADAYLFIKPVNKAIKTDENGFYNVSLKTGDYIINVNYLGFKEFNKEINISSDKKFNIYLQPQAESLDEVVVEEDIERVNIKDPQMSVNRLTAETIKRVPVVLGEADVLRSLIKLPGITNAGEGSSGFNVRGGGADQNLVLMDDATIYNSSHLFGLFSVFNPNAVENLTLYKGGIPPRYGGRLSSVLDVDLKSGDLKQFKADANIGVVSSKLNLQGPVEKNKTSYYIGGRSSYAHLFLKLTDNSNSAYFYDMNAKVKHKFNEDDQLYFSGYLGRDVFSLAESFKNTYGNSFASIRWKHRFNDDISSNLSFTFTDYLYRLNLEFVGFEFENGIYDFDVNYDINHYISDKIQFRYGLESIYHTFNPGFIQPTTESSGITEDQLPRKYAFDNGAYLGVSQDITENLKLDYGLRLSAFYRLGQNEIPVYENNNPIIYNETLNIYEEAEPIRTFNRSNTEVIESFYNLEPRFSAAYSFSDQTSVKASYNRMVQNMHLISNTSSPTPLDIWTPSGTFIKPEKLDQFAVGFFKELNDGLFSFEIESFYKTIDNKIDYVDGADLIANDDVERFVLSGEARSYGLEFLFKKNKGDFTGWLAYTLSRSEQKTPGRTPEEPGIAGGDWYLANYDKTHDLSIVANYDWNKQWKFNASFSAQTGLPVNFPVGQFEFQGLNIPVFEGRNTNRLPTIHRLDISANYTPKKQNNWWEASWNFSIYNVYNRMNAAALSFEQNRNTGVNEAVRLSIFGIVPAVSYQIKF